MRVLRVHLIFLALVCTATVLEAGGNDDWQYYAGTGHWYRLTSSKLTWTMAEQAAVAEGGHLVTVNNAVENAWLLQQFGSVGDWLWIGLLQAPGNPEPNGGWAWVNGEPLIFKNWAAGEPNQYNGSPENMAVMYEPGNVNGGGKWNDDANAALHYGIIELHTVPNLITNGDFNQNADGWAVINHANANWSSMPGWDGVPGCFFVNHAPGGHPETSQLIEGLVPGWHYSIAGYYRRDTRNWPDLNFRLLLGAETYFEAGGTVAQGWTPFSFSYTAANATVLLRFQAQITGDDAYFIDHLSFKRSTTAGAGTTEMALIPAGEFQMGDTFNEGQTNERPVHDVYVDAFYMDRYEITNQRYAEALNWALDGV